MSKRAVLEGCRKSFPYPNSIRGSSRHMGFVVSETERKQAFVPIIWVSAARVIPPIVHAHSFMYH